MTRESSRRGKPAEPPAPLLPSRVELVLVTRDERRPEPPAVPKVRVHMKIDGQVFEVEGPAHEHQVQDAISELKNAARCLGDKARAEARLADEQRVLLLAQRRAKKETEDAG